MSRKRVFLICVAIVTLAIGLSSGLSWASSDQSGNPCASANTFVYFYKTAQYGPGAPQGPFYGVYGFDYTHLDEYGNPTYVNPAEGLTLTYKPSGANGSGDTIEKFSWKVAKDVNQVYSEAEWRQNLPKHSWSGHELGSSARAFAVNTTDGSGTRNINFVSVCAYNPKLGVPQSTTPTTSGVPPTTAP